MASEVLVSQIGRVGRITLNRPCAVNALTLEMIGALSRTLEEWRSDPTVELVVLDGAGGRGFCAGGDIRVVHDSARAADGAADTLWREEYQLDAAVARFPKPLISILDGITMGGGMGIGCHRPIRVVTERSTLAMPEVRIGMCPDVGGCLLLVQAPGHIGEHLALTAGSVGPDDAVYCGFADCIVPDVDVEELVRRFQSEHPAMVLDELSRPPGDAALARDAAWIDACYPAGSVTEILDRLASHPEPRAREAAEQIRRMPPLGLTVTLRALRQTRPDTPLEDVLARDLRVMTRFLDTPDLVEGIR
ncbi:MAG: 3-hydroxyisobutyryl-CoA hydrolase, partial [Micromonosporaceae bacterium]